MSSGGAVLLAARLVLAGTFAVAAVAKLVDMGGSRAAMRSLGIPRALTGTAAVLVPLAEIGIAAALLPAGSAVPAAVAAALLLAAFTVVLAGNLLLGRRPDCHCFGRLLRGPAGWSAVARNAALLGLAVLVLAAPVAGGGPSAVAWAWEPGAPGGVILVAALVVGGCSSALTYVLLRRHGRLLLRVEALEAQLTANGIALPGASSAGGVFVKGLDPGAAAPDFALDAAGGGSVSLRSLRAAGRPVALVFASPGCGPCRDLLPLVARWQGEHADTVTVAVVSAGDRAVNEALAAEHGLQIVGMQREHEVADAYRVTATPSAVLVSPAGTVAGPVAQGRGAVERLLAGALSAPVLPVHHAGRRTAVATSAADD